MQIIITPEQISFKRRLYTVSIPKQSAIRYLFYDYRTLSGMPVAMELKSNNTIITSPIGIIGKIICYLTIAWASILIKPKYHSPSPTIIYFIKEIESFLAELDNNGYQVDDQIQQLQSIKDKETPKQSIPGTEEWKKDKLKLVLVVFVIFELIASPIIFSPKITLKSISTFLAVSVFIAFICFMVYMILKKIKK